MGKKQKPKRKEVKEVEAKPHQQIPPAVASDSSDDSFNFGGLPERNLKKNLGCG